MNPTRIGVIGIGSMGLPMARRLADAGFAVAVRDLRPEAEAAARDAGLAVAASAAELARRSEVLVVVVVDATQIADALFDEPEPAVAGWAPGTPVLLCSTIGPDAVAGLAARIGAAGAAAVDAPISGGPVRAGRGELSFMLAGPAALLDAVAPVTAALATRAFRISARVGDGARMKLLNNLLAGINLASAAQALALGEAMGLDPRQMLDVIGCSSGQSWIADDRLPRALAGDYAARARAAILAKDLGLAMQAIGDAGFASGLGAAALARFDVALAAGLGEADDAVLLELERAAVRGPS